MDLVERSANEGERAESVTSTLNPANIRFSHISVRNSYVWDSSKYSKCIVVAQYPTHCCSYDNRRLLAAQIENETRPFKLLCDLQNWDVDMDMNRAEVQQGFFSYLLWVGNCDVNSASKGVYKIDVVPKTYGALIALRCARQAKDMPLDGRDKQPRVETFKRESDYRAKGPAVPNSPVCNGVDLLEDAFKTNKVVCVSLQTPGQRYCHQDLAAFFSGNVDRFLRIDSCVYQPETWLKAAADFDEQDKAWDRESAERDILYEEEMDRSWEELEAKLGEDTPR